MKRILITGGAGFIGFHLARALAQDESNRIVLVDDLSRSQHVDAELGALEARANVHLHVADLTDPGALRCMRDPFDEVYHLAGVVGVRNVMGRPDRVVRVNALSVLNVLDWFSAAEAGKLLFASTSEAYAWTALFHDVPVPTPEDVPLAIPGPFEPRASYAGSKLFGELACAQYAAVFDRPVTIVRYHNVYGPRMGTAHVIPELALRALGGEAPLRVWSPDHTRAFCFVDDAVDATVRAMRTPKADGRVIHVGDDRSEIRIDALARLVVAALELECALAPQTAEHDPITRRCPDLSLARRLLDYAPRTSLDEGVRRTVGWYRRQLEEEKGDLRR